MNLRSIDRGRLLLELGPRSVKISCEPLSAAWWIYPIETWRWDDGASIDPSEMRSLVAALRAAAADAGIELDLDDLPNELK